jgi:hypothetical protein
VTIHIKYEGGEREKKTYTPISIPHVYPSRNAYKQMNGLGINQYSSNGSKHLEKGQMEFKSKSFVNQNAHRHFFKHRNTHILITKTIFRKQ